MRLARLMTAVAVAWVVAVGVIAVPSAQAPMSEEDFDKLMKAVGASSGATRKALEAQAADTVAAEAKKMIDLQKGNVAFWKARNTPDATEWATAALNHATALEKAATAKDLNAAAESAKLLMGTCGQCHTKYRDKGADGYILKKG